jgi:uncharacterized protein YjhX (UPF0386 family)
VLVGISTQRWPYILSMAVGDIRFLEHREDEAFHTCENREGKQFLNAKAEIFHKNINKKRIVNSVLSYICGKN